MTTRWARVLRGLVAAFTSTLIAAGSHAFSGGSLPGVSGIALCLAFSALVCISLAGRSLSRLRLTIAVTLSQLMFHGLFSLMADASPAGSHGSPALHSAMMMGPGVLGDTLSSPVSHSPQLTSAADSLMWAGHALAAALTVVALARGERAFWRFAALTVLLFARILHSPRVHIATQSPSRSVIAEGRALLPRVSRLLHCLHPHRGPPAVSLAG